MGSGCGAQGWATWETVSTPIYWIFEDPSLAFSFFLSFSAVTWHDGGAGYGRSVILDIP